MLVEQDVKEKPHGHPGRKDDGASIKTVEPCDAGKDNEQVKDGFRLRRAEVPQKENQHLRDSLGLSRFGDTTNQLTERHLDMKTREKGVCCYY
jgi:hypothetical protein